MKHIYISPHLDDVVLSCGGAIHQHTSAGDAVRVITVFAGDAPPEAGLSPFARVQHDYWGDPPRPMALRRAEDNAALARLAAQGQHLDYADAVYRTIPGGEWLYASEESLWADVHPADPVAANGARGLADLIPQEDKALIRAPLGLGNHIDHQIVHQAAQRLLEQGWRVAFYEDYPYAEGQQTPMAEGWCVETIPLEAADVSAKVAAIRYYRTQMFVLFGGSETMPSRVWAFAADPLSETGLSERLWHPPEA